MIYFVEKKLIFFVLSLFSEASVQFISRIVEIDRRSLKVTIYLTLHMIHSFHIN